MLIRLELKLPVDSESASHALATLSIKIIKKKKNQMWFN